MKLFGTDGVRGQVNTPPMTADWMVKLGVAVGYHFRSILSRHHENHPPTVLIGKDTRLSGYLFEHALAAGLTSMGFDIAFVGPLPTPAIAQLTRSMRADLGVMISASHNPYTDNGVKFFGPDGYKLHDQDEQGIESLFGQLLDPASQAIPLVSGDHVGTARRIPDAGGRYIEFLKNSVPKGFTLEGLKLVIDCANGSAYRVGPQLFWELGAQVTTLNAEPDGRNINADCGALHTEGLAQTVVETGADAGIALDGDADRAILIDEMGRRVDGDQILALLAKTWQIRGQLTGDGIVATVMSNLGLEKFLDGHGLRLHRCRVGDRYVVELMRQLGLNLGGEQSGHVILGDYATTGDGLLTALQVLSVMIDHGKKLSEVTHVFAPVPQILKNLRIKSLSPSFLDDPRVVALMKRYEAQLNGNGRILVRPSGTEPLLRIMIEGPDLGEITQISEQMGAEIQNLIEGSRPFCSESGLSTPT